MKCHFANSISRIETRLLGCSCRVTESGRLPLTSL